jgi:alpha-galactosidase
VIRDDGGAPAIASTNWERNNFGLDGSNPDARAWLTDLFGQVCDGWGYDYVKIDFLFGAAIKGRRSDPAATRISAYRAALDAVRAGVGPDRFILGCGSLMAPSVGFFDGNRIGPDVAPFWRFMTREERSRPNARPRTANDGLSAETAIRNTLTRSWMHNRLWANDPDCLLVREDRTKLTLDETRTLASAIGLSGGMMLVSDDMEHVAPERRDLISMLLPPLPLSATPIDLMERDMPERFEIADDRKFDPVKVVGLFNFADEPRDLELALPPGRWQVFELWEERYRGIAEGAVTFDLVAPHSCRVVALRPQTEGPELVGTTAHIGMGMLDITGACWNDSPLVAQVTPAGRRRRRVYFDAAGQTASAEFGGRSLAVHRAGRAYYVELDVDGASELALTFEK